MKNYNYLSDEITMERNFEDGADYENVDNFTCFWNTNIRTPAES